MNKFLHGLGSWLIITVTFHISEKMHLTGPERWNVLFIALVWLCARLEHREGLKEPKKCYLFYGMIV